jgi:hypothetical protein
MWSLRLLIAVCVYAGVRGLGTAWLTLRDFELYRNLEAAGSPLLRIGCNALFGIALLTIAWGLYQRRKWAFKTFLPVLGSYAIFNFIWLATYAQADYDQGRKLFSLVTSILGMGFILWLRMRLRKLFGEWNVR